MKIAALSPDEEKRLTALASYHILDTLPEQDFDDLTQIASHICDTPIALISFVDDHRQWFKSRVGLDVAETPRDVAFCSHAILSDDLFVVNDSFKDERFYDNPLATDAPHVRFYAGAPLITPAGDRIGTLCVIDNHPRELTDNQKQALTALSRQVMSQLELRMAMQQCKEATMAKSLFLANMSHEIRTPMNAVISCTHLLMDEIKNEKSLELLHIIDHAGDTLLTLINDILDFSKIESGKIVLEEEAFDIHDCLDEMVQLLNNRAEDLNIQLTLDISKQSPQWVTGDITRFRQIVINLIGNAIKFSKSRVEVSLSTTHKKGAELILLAVKDDGIGISKDEQGNIFKDFSQIDASITRKYGGTGLGLSICRGLTQAMNGEIWLDSELGKGSTFYASLSLKKAQPHEKKQKTPLSEINPDMGKKFPLKILLAEDDAVNQIIIKQMFEKLSYDIDLVSDGNEAVESCQHCDYDIVFMDMQMPELDGISATKLIRKSDFKQPIIIALTANAFIEDKNLCIEAGMNGFLTKPVDLGKIVIELHKAISS